MNAEFGVDRNPKTKINVVMSARANIMPRTRKMLFVARNSGRMNMDMSTTDMMKLVGSVETVLARFTMPGFEVTRPSPANMGARP